MSRNRIYSVVVIALLTLLIVWIARHTYWESVTLPVPPKGEAATNRFYIMQRFAESLGARTQWHRDLLVLPSVRGAVVVSSWNWTLFANRRRQLERWVESGGRLILPDSSLIRSNRALEEWTGISIPPLGEITLPNKIRLGRSTPLDDKGCSIVTVGGNEPPESHPRSSYSYCGLWGNDHFVTNRKVSWALSDSRGMRAVRVPIGKGSVTVFDAAPFGLPEFLQGDNAAMFVDGTQLRHSDEIYFLSDSQGASLLQILWKYGAPAVIIALTLVALALWRTSVRFGPLATTPERARRSLAEQIRGTGEFTAKFGGGRALHAAAARALGEAASVHVTHYHRLPSDERVATLARLTGLSSSELSQALNYAGPRRPASLRSALALLEFARRTVSRDGSAPQNNREGSRHAS